MTKTQANIGGEIGVNGYFYKGGQFLPSTQAEPGKWKIGKKWVFKGRELVAPGQFEIQPTPFSRALFVVAGVGYLTIVQNGTMTLNPGANGNGVIAHGGERVTRELMIRPGVKGVLGKEELTLGEIIDAWNNGARWFDVQPDAEVITK